MKYAAVIGYPVSQSLSPKLHGYWLKKYNLEGSYTAIEIRPEEFEETFHRLHEKGLVGFNITIPYKEQALRLVDESDSFAKSIGAVNTVVIRDGRYMGYNTDAYGFTENIKQSVSGFSFKGKTAVVIGAGGAARAVVAGMLAEGADKVIITNRTVAKAEKIKHDIAGNIETAGWEERNNVLADADILVNTTSLGMAGQPELDLRLDLLPRLALVTDIVYKPLQTTLLAHAKERGNITVDGLGMLLYQAVAGFEKWFGVKPEVTQQLRNNIIEGST